MVNQVIANVYNSDTKTWGPVASNVYYSTSIIGLGQIDTFTSNNTIIGTQTTFLTQLANNYPLRSTANVYIGKISNVISDTRATLSTNAKTAMSSIATSTSGVGNIAVSAGSTTIIGYGTTFLTQLSTNYLIRDINNVCIGKINNVLSNTSATLVTNALYAISSNVNPTNFNYQTPSNYNYQTYTRANIDFDTSSWTFTADPHLGNGTITVSNANNIVSGTSTAFKMQLKDGFQIFANTGIVDELIGVVKGVFSNTSATLTTNAVANVSSVSYHYYNPVTKNTSNVFPKNSHLLHSAMLDWSQSGLIAGVSQVKSYHPPVQDPITGVLVNFPATMHSTRNKKKRLVYSKLNTVNNLPNSQTTGKNLLIHDFDAQNGIVGSSIQNAVNSIPINNVINKLSTSNINDAQYAVSVPNAIKQVYGNPNIPSAPGLVVSAPPAGFTQINNLTITNAPYTAYQGPGANVVYVLNQSVLANVYPTAADQFSLAVGFAPLNRITDVRSDANAYYSITNPVDTLTDAQRADLAARASSQFTTDSYKRVVNTGVPAAIPGTLNVALADENPSNRPFANIGYSNAFVRLTFDNNKDLPPSILNPLPSVTVIAPTNQGS